MTSEKRTLISPRDILSVGFECPHCKATYFVPVEKIDIGRPLRQCPNCQQSFATDAPVTGDYSDLKMFMFLVDCLQKIRARTFGEAIRFEVSDIKPEVK